MRVLLAKSVAELRSGENVRMRRLTLLGVLAGVVLAGCSGSIRGDRPSVPTPSVARFVPHGYRVVRTYRADLSGGVVPDVIVSSAGGMGADLQVLSWSRAAGRWRLTFDGRSAPFSSGVVTVVTPGDSNSGPGEPGGLFGMIGGVNGPLLGNLPDLYVAVDRVAFAPVLSGGRNQMVFSGTYVAGTGERGILVVVSFDGGKGKVIYSWAGLTGLGYSWYIRHHVIHAWANYLVPANSVCCALREYRFALGARAGRIVEVYDDRPFLGVILRYPGAPYTIAAIAPTVVHTDPHGPADGLLRPGDMILSVENGPHVSGYSDGSTPFTVGPGPESTRKYPFVDTVSSFHAGQTARLLIQRGKRHLIVSVKLGSLKSPEASAIRTPRGNQVAL